MISSQGIVSIKSCPTKLSFFYFKIGEDNTIDVEPKGVCSHHMDKKFFDSNWVKIICEFASTGASPTYTDYKWHDPEIKQYIDDNIPLKTELIKKFEANLSIGMERYIASKQLQGTNHHEEKITAYDKFFNHPENMQLARDIQKTYPQPIQDPTIINTLNSLLLPKTVPVHPVDYESIKPQPCVIESSVLVPQTLDGAISHVEDQLKVQFIRKRFLGSIYLNVLNWWYGWGLRRYHIADNLSPYCEKCNDPNTLKFKTIGEVIIHESLKLPATTTPLLTTGLPTVFINTTGDYNYVHELAHAVHFSFVPFYKIPRDMIEIAPMCMENSVRRDRWQPISAQDLQRQAALAIADLTATTPDEFNEIFAENAGLKDVGHVRARMWHLTNMYGKYYSYVLGMGANNYEQLKFAVRSGDKKEQMKLCIGYKDFCDQHKDISRS